MVADPSPLPSRWDRTVRGTLRPDLRLQSSCALGDRREESASVAEGLVVTAGRARARIRIEEGADERYAWPRNVASSTVTGHCGRLRRRPHRSRDSQPAGNPEGPDPNASLDPSRGGARTPRCARALARCARSGAIMTQRRARRQKAQQIRNGAGASRSTRSYAGLLRLASRAASGDSGTTSVRALVRATTAASEASSGVPSTDFSLGDGAFLVLARHASGRV